MVDGRLAATLLPGDLQIGSAGAIKLESMRRGAVGRLKDDKQLVSAWHMLVVCHGHVQMHIVSMPGQPHGGSKVRLARVPARLIRFGQEEVGHIVFAQMRQRLRGREVGVAAFVGACDGNGSNGIST